MDIHSHLGSYPSATAASPTTGTPVTATVSVVKTENPPASAVGFYISADDTNTDDIRVCMGGVATTTVGFQLQAGRSEQFTWNMAISLCAQSGIQGYSIAWITP